MITEKRRPFPLVRLIFPFVAGILIAVYTSNHYLVPWWLYAGLILLSAVYVFYLSKKISYRLRWIYGLFLYAFVMLSGYTLTVRSVPALDPAHLMNLPYPSEYMLVRLIAPPQVREKSVKVEVEMMINGDTSKARPCAGNLMLYLARDSGSALLGYGDVLLLRAKPDIIAPPSNPDAFNYREYLRNRGVYHQVFVKNSDWKKLGTGKKNPLYDLAYRARAAILKILTDHQLSGREFAVTSALLIGYTDKLDADLLNDYSGTGAMHILSVSGMHVGLIYAVLNMLLFFFDKLKYGKIPKAALLLLFIWAYAVLTGLSPSVLRAASMFSLIVIGNSLNQSSDIINSLAASAMALLMVNPWFIMDMGFQLSYVAVLGIVVLQPSISAWWTPTNWLFKQLWSLISVSVAAQLATFPLGLYYFHQFPNYFLLTNIVALPLSSAIIYLALVVLALSFVPVVATFLAKILSWMVMALNTGIGIIENLPGSVTRGAYVSLAETLLIYALILVLLTYFFSRYKPGLFAALVLGILLCVSVLVRNVRTEGQSAWVVYDAGKSGAMDFLYRRERLLVADSALLMDQYRIDYCSGGFVERRGIRQFAGIRSNTEVYSGFKGNFYKFHNFIQFMGHRLAIVNHREQAQTPIRVDFVVLSGNVDMTIADVLKNYRTGMIIVDATNSRKRTASWIRQCEGAGVQCWPVAEKGAFVLEGN